MQVVTHDVHLTATLMVLWLFLNQQQLQCVDCKLFESTPQSCPPQKSSTLWIRYARSSNAMKIRFAFAATHNY